MAAAALSQLTLHTSKFSSLVAFGAGFDARDTRVIRMHGIEGFVVVLKTMRAYHLASLSAFVATQAFPTLSSSYVFWGVLALPTFGLLHEAITGRGVPERCISAFRLASVVANVAAGVMALTLAGLLQLSYTGLAGTGLMLIAEYVAYLSLGGHLVF